MKDKFIDYYIGQGFTKSGKYLYHNINNVLLIFELQRTKVFNGFYLNIGVYYEDIGGKRRKPPASDKWHLSARYCHFLSQNKIALYDDMSENDLLSVFSKVDNRVLPYFKKLCDFDYLVDNYPNKFPHDIVWLQNMGKEEFITFIRSKT